MYIDSAELVSWVKVNSFVPTVTVIDPLNCSSTSIPSVASDMSIVTLTFDRTGLNEMRVVT